MMSIFIFAKNHTGARVWKERRRHAGIVSAGLVLGILGLLFSPQRSEAQTAPVPTNTPTTISADITPGAEAVELPFTVSGADGVTLEVIVPVDNAVFSLIDPAGSTVLTSGDAAVTFTPGSELAPGAGLPGGVFTTEAIADPVDGEWTIRLTFPAAPEPTIALASVFVRTAIQAGIALARESYLTGENISIGMLVLNQGQPVTGLSPDVSVTPPGPTGAVDTAVALDDGEGADGQAGDGVYSRAYTFPQSGEYLIEGEVTVPTPDGPVVRQASRRVTVSDPPVALTSVTANPVQGPGGCIERIEAVIELNVMTAGEYVVQGDLQSNNGNTITARERADFTSGPQSIVLVYSGEDIVQGLGQDGPFTVSSLDVLSFSDDAFELAARGTDVDSVPGISLDSICRAPIEIGTDPAVNATVQDGYIASLEFVIPVTVQTAGNYQMSFKVIGDEGEDIELAAFSRSLAAGLNEVSFSLNADRFQAADGPYRVISALVLGAGETAQRASVGASPAYQRWQFRPTRPGDLDADGDVDADDRAIVLEARNSPALDPGDRRDLVRDGTIDLRDARAILRLR